jgi:hypothetical protein
MHMMSLFILNTRSTQRKSMSFATILPLVVSPQPMFMMAEMLT